MNERIDYGPELYEQYQVILKERDDAIEVMEYLDDEIRNALDILSGLTAWKEPEHQIENAKGLLNAALIKTTAGGTVPTVKETGVEELPPSASVADTASPTPAVEQAKTSTTPAEHAAAVREDLRLVFGTFPVDPVTGCPACGKNESPAHYCAPVVEAQRRLRDGTNINEVLALAERATELEHMLAYAHETAEKSHRILMAERERAGRAERERDEMLERLPETARKLGWRDPAWAERAETALRGVAWKDSQGLCWCPGETEFAVAHPDAEHTERCKAASAALGETATVTPTDHAAIVRARPAKMPYTPLQENPPLYYITEPELAALVALAERANDQDARVDALMTELERGYILRSTHDSIVQGLAERATELERERDAMEIIAEGWKGTANAERARAERAETALREAWEHLNALVGLGETAPLQEENLAARVQEAKRLLEAGDQNALIAYLLRRDPAEIAALGERHE